MSGSIERPTKIRVMSEAEYGIVSRVFGDTLPYKFRIWITNAAGIDGRAFTIPTSLISSILNVPMQGFFALTGGYATSFINLAYLINVGSANYNALATTNQKLLVHETAHVWQGKNSTFSQSYVYNSIFNQCFKGNSAYNYVLGKPWTSYNAEQQAKIIEDWFVRGEQTSDNAWVYIANQVRAGNA